MLAKQLWQLSEAGEPALLLGRDVDAVDVAIFERLLACGVLHHAGRLTHWDVCAACDCGRDDRPIRSLNGAWIAICPSHSERDQVLSADELASFSLSIPDLVAKSAEDSRFPRRPEEIEAGIWRLGRLEHGPVVFVVPTRHAMYRPGLVGTLRQIEPAGDILLLGPTLPQRTRAHFVCQHIYHVSLQDRLIASAVVGPLALDCTLPTSATRTVRLRLKPSSLKVELDGHTAQFQARTFQLLHLLVQRAKEDRPIVSAAEIYSAMFGSSTSPDRVRGLVGELRRQLVNDLSVSSVIIETRSGLGYCISLAPEAMLLEP